MARPKRLGEGKRLVKELDDAIVKLNAWSIRHWVGSFFSPEDYLPSVRTFSFWYNSHFDMPQGQILNLVQGTNKRRLREVNGVHREQLKTGFVQRDLMMIEAMARQEDELYLRILDEGYFSRFQEGVDRELTVEERRLYLTRKLFNKEYGLV